MSCSEDVSVADNAASASIPVSIVVHPHTTLPRPGVLARFDAADDAHRRDGRLDSWFSTRCKYIDKKLYIDYCLTSGMHATRAICSACVNLLNI